MNDLELLLLAAADDGEQEPAFTAALLESEVLVLGESELDQIAIATWGDEDGDIVPFFTSEDMINASADQMPGLGTTAFALPCRELWQFTAGSRLVLNPHGPVARVYAPVEVAALLAGVDPRAGTEVSYEDLDLEVSVPGPHWPPPCAGSCRAARWSRRPTWPGSSGARPTRATSCSCSRVTPTRRWPGSRTSTSRRCSAGTRST